MKHIDSPELTSLMGKILDDISYNIAILEHRDWNADSCIFSLAMRDRFIEASLKHLGNIQRDCGGCAIVQWNKLSVWIQDTFEFFGVTPDNRFGDAFNTIVTNSTLEHENELRDCMAKLLGR